MSTQIRGSSSSRGGRKETGASSAKGPKCEYELVSPTTPEEETKATLTSIRALLEEQLEPFHKEFDDMRAELKLATDKMNSITAINTKVKNLETNQNMFEQKLKKCETRCKDLEAKLCQVESFSRKNNLKFLNITHEPGVEAQENCEEVIINKCAGYGIHLGPRDIERAHRMGPQSKKNRPIIVKFTNFKDKISVLREKQKFRSDGITIVEDFPIEIQARRRTFAPILRAAYSSDGKYRARLVSDKLSLNGKFYTIGDLGNLPDELKLTNLSTRSQGGITAFFTKYSILSNHYRCSFKEDENTHSSVEQYLMFHKAMHFKDLALSKRILETDDPVEAKSLGKTVSNFNLPAWKAVQDERMKNGLRAKFRQNPSLVEFLKATDSCVLVEANVNDLYWGAGLSIAIATSGTVLSGRGRIGLANF